LLFELAEHALDAVAVLISAYGLQSKLQKVADCPRLENATVDGVDEVSVVFIVAVYPLSRKHIASHFVGAKIIVADDLA
jgi:hypothetical protein